MGGQPCSVAVAAADMTDGERAAFTAALLSPSVNKSEVARALRKAGHPVSSWTLRHHVRGECKCRIHGWPTS
jgi:hypothetical protein